jgi:stage V sporulation protein SpoVS
MASRKLTFTLPTDLAAQFLRRVPASQRSQYVAAAIAAKLREREEYLAQACEVANSSADVLAIETSLDALSDEADRVQEPW